MCAIWIFVVSIGFQVCICSRVICFVYFVLLVSYEYFA